MGHHRKQLPIGILLALYKRDDYRCWYCGINLLNLVKTFTGVLDHVWPLSRGGADAPENLVVACDPCNAMKADRTLEEYRAAIAATTGIRSILFYGEGERDVVWLCMYRRWKPMREVTEESRREPGLLIFGDDGFSIDTTHTFDLPCPR